MSAGPLVVTYPLTRRSREIVAEELDGTAEAIYLVDLAPADRVHALGRAGAVLSHDTSKELRPDEIPLIRNARLLQFTAAGVDWVPTRDLPWELPIAANKGGGAEPMSEHIVALALAAAKRLFIEHANLKSGEFNQRSANGMLRGGVCGVLGFGNVGVATARLMRAFGMKIHAINRRGASDDRTAATVKVARFGVQFWGERNATVGAVSVGGTAVELIPEEGSPPGSSRRSKPGVMGRRGGGVQ
jgi:phosphoglycerate dehydrogenase-like enzyme